MGNQISYSIEDQVLDLGSKGSIKGIQYDNKARRYAGVPYAFPPTGDHRWRKPRPLPSSYSYTGEDGAALDATKFRRQCLQGATISGGPGKAGTEDCLYVNIWTPVEKTQANGEKWPVMIWIHGGWFQIGNASQEVDMDPTELVGTSGLNAVFVAVSYRLGIFGFLSSKALLEDTAGEAAGNFGLWDQRLAIEWVYENIGHFGGDVNNITLSGRSAGAYSVEAQTLYEFRGKKKSFTEKPFHRIFMCSNAIPAQPKTITEVEPQFDEVCKYFKIPSSLSGTEKLNKLRQIPQKDLIAATPHLENHTFRPVTDDIFFHSNFIEYIQGGEFATEFKNRGMRLFIGEVSDEDKLYAQYRSPEEGTIEALRLQTANYYAPATTDRVLGQYKLPESTEVAEWKALFGHLIADGQVLAPSRCFVDALHRHGVSMSDIWRYRIGYRLSFITEKVAPMSYKVTHSMDKSFWNFSIMHGPTDPERRLMEDWIQNLIAFVHDDKSFEFGTKEIDEVKAIKSDGTIEVVKDERYEELKRLGELFARGE